MNAKVLRVIQIANIVLMLAFAPVGFFVLLFAFSSMVDTHSLGKMGIVGFGYLVAVIAGLLSFKRNFLLVVSLLGWGIVFWGQYGYEDSVGAKKEQTLLCQLIRQKSQCTEDINGIVSCTGSLAGTSADCKGVPK